MLTWEPGIPFIAAEPVTARRPIVRTPSGATLGKLAPRKRLRSAEPAIPGNPRPLTRNGRVGGSSPPVGSVLP
jgi:hypothetical protein